MKRRFHHGGRVHHHAHGSPRGGRLLDYGELRLLVLAMLATRPCHGYELMKAIEERSGGSYAPSPGVIYPTLSWLADIGYALMEEGISGRKCYRSTPEGEALLRANRATAEELLSRLGGSDARVAARAPDTVLRAVENLKLTMRLRLRRGSLDQDAAQTIAAALDIAARAVERS